MTSYDLIDETIIDAAPGVVWKALVDELNGSGGWWLPHNTFEPGSRPPELVGGRTRVTVHPGGADAGGPKLRFTSRTRAVDPGRRLTGEYVSGVFRGTNEFVLTPVVGGRTRLAMAFRAEPRGWVRLLARLTDIGLEHSRATRAAFANLDAMVGGAPSPGRPVPAPVERTEHVVRTDDDAELSVTVLGPAPGQGRPTVVLAHGWAATSEVWTAVTERLLHLGHSVVLYDQRGHGDSGPGRAETTIARLGADLGAVLAAVDVKDAVLVGHSGGGFAAMELVTSDPDAAARVRGLVLLGTAAHDQDTPDSEVSMMGGALFSRAVSTPWLGRRLLRRTMGTDTAGLESNRRMFAATAPAVRAEFFRSSRGMNLRRALSEVAIPAVVLAGDLDRVVAPRLGEAVAGVLPNARFERVAGVGHMVPLEAPDKVALVVAELAGRD